MALFMSAKKKKKTDRGKKFENRRFWDLFRSWVQNITSLCGSRSVQQRSRAHVLWPRCLSTPQDRL